MIAAFGPSGTVTDFFFVTVLEDGLTRADVLILGVALAAFGGAVLTAWILGW